MMSGMDALEKNVLLKEWLSCSGELCRVNADVTRARFNLQSECQAFVGT
jgi:hypothetical protein